jgi:hypothetical protein
MPDHWRQTSTGAKSITPNPTSQQARSKTKVGAGAQPLPAGGFFSTLSITPNSAPKNAPRA